MSGGLRRRLPGGRTPVVLALLALALYLPGFWWGLPDATGPERIHGWAVDDETPLGPLAQVNNILHPQEVQNLGYPLMHSFMLVAAYAPYLGWLKLSGAWAGPQGADYPYGFRDPVAALKGLSLIGHFVSVLLGVVVVLGAWAAARAMWDDRTGIAAALVTLVSYPMFYYSRTGNVDVPMMAFIAIAVAAYARGLRAPATPALALVLGASAGFALATKEQALGVFLAMPVVLLILHLRPAASGTPAGAPQGAVAWQVPALAVAALVLAFGVGSGLFVDPTRFFAHLDHARERMALARSGQLEFIPVYPKTLEGQVDLARLLLTYLAQVMSLPGLLLAVVGVAWAGWRDRRALLLALPAATYLALLYLATRTGQLRYLMPPAFILSLFAGRALVLALASGQRRLRVAGIAAGVLVLGLGLLRGADLTWAMLRDGRYAAAEWMAAVARPGDRVEFFGSPYKLPALPASLDLAAATPHLGPLVPVRRDQAAVEEIAAGWAARRPRFILILPDWSSREGEDFPASCPPALCDALAAGRLGYRLAAEFQAPPLLPWVRRPPLDYPLVNTRLRIFVPADDPVS